MQRGGAVVHRQQHAPAHQLMGEPMGQPSYQQQPVAVRRPQTQQQHVHYDLSPRPPPRQAHPQHPHPHQYEHSPAPSPSARMRTVPSTSRIPYQQQPGRYEYQGGAVGDQSLVVDRDGRVLSGLPAGASSEARGPAATRGGSTLQAQQMAQQRREEQQGGYQYDQSYPAPQQHHHHHQPSHAPHQQSASLPEPDTRDLFHSYILDYLQKHGHHRAAHAFLRDVPDTPLQPLQPGQVHPASMKGKGKGRMMDHEGGMAGPHATGGQRRGPHDSTSPGNGGYRMEESVRDGPRPRSSGHEDDSIGSTGSSATHYGFAPDGTPLHGDYDSPPVNYRSLPHAAVQIETPQGFLFEWWSVFWDVFRSKAGKGGTISSRAFVEASSQAVELGLSQNPDAAQSYQRSMQSSRMPSPPRNGPPYRHPGEPAYESPHTQPQLHQRQSTGPPQQQPLAPQHPQQGGNGRPTAQQQAHMLRAQEAAHAAAAAAQQAQAMRANAANGRPQQQPSLARRGAMSPAPLQSLPPPNGQGQDQALARQRQQQQGYASQQQQVHRQQQAAAQAQLGVKMQHQQQQAHAAAQRAHAEAAARRGHGHPPSDVQQQQEYQRPPQQQQALTHRPESAQGSPYDYPLSPSKRFNMTNGGPDAQHQHQHQHVIQGKGGSPYQNGTNYASPSQQAEYNQRSGVTAAQAEALSYALGDANREHHSRMVSNEAYSRSPVASSPAYQQQQRQQQQGHSRPHSGAPTPQQLDAATSMMEPQSVRISQQQQLQQKGSMAPPQQTNGRPMPNRSMSQATANGGGTGSAGNTPQGGATPGAVDYISPNSLQAPTPTAAPIPTSPAAPPVAKRKREAKDPPREGKKRAVSTRDRSNSVASTPAAAPTPSPSMAVAPLPATTPIANGLPDSYAQSPAGAFDSSALESTSLPNGDLSVDIPAAQGFGGDEGGEADGFMSQEQIDNLWSTSLATGSAVPDIGSFDFDSFFAGDGASLLDTSFDLQV